MHLSRRQLLAGAAASALESACASACLDAPCAKTPSISDHLPPPEPLDVPLAATREQISAFDEIRFAVPTVYRPTNEDAIEKLLKAAAREHRRVTIRAGGNSFDSQALNDDIVIQMGTGFDDIGDPCLDEDGHYYITCGAAAKWWDVLLKIAPLGLFPPSMATAGDAMVGGTLSADCVSRMSCTTGKEGKQVRSFWIVLLDGRCLECKRDDDDDERRTLFNAVIGGFGYLGVVTRVTFDLMVIRTNPNVPGRNPVVLTRSTRHGANVDWHDLLATLHAKVRENRIAYEGTGTKRALCAVEEPSPLAIAPIWPALSITSFLNGPSLSANLFEQGFAESRPLNPTPSGIYAVNPTFIAQAEYDTSWWPTMIEVALELGFPQGEFVDDLFGWAFFLGNSTTQAKANAHCANPPKRLNFIQQSFALPSGPSQDVVDTAPTRRFVELLVGRLHTAGLRPVNIDFLFVPEDCFLMSASNQFPSFVVTIAFSDTNRAVLPARTEDLLCAASHDCRTLGGRVHLVKNVIADPGDLRAMHGDAARAMKRLKGTYDPSNVLKNEFFDRVFDA